MKLSPTPFKNSDTCQGLSFATPAAPLDMARIEITGRYPETGWALNQKSHELVYVAAGSGVLLQEEAEIPLVTGDAVHVAPGECFAWNGTMTLIMACDPPFSPDQYELTKGDAQ